MLACALVLIGYLETSLNTAITMCVVPQYMHTTVKDYKKGPNLYEVNSKILDTLSDTSIGKIALRDLRLTFAKDPRGGR